MTDWLAVFSAIWLVDFEFHAPPGERPKPICMVAREFFSGRLVRLWFDESTSPAPSPFDLGDGSLYVAYYASAELLCHIALQWPMPLNVLDLFAEFRCDTNGLSPRCGNGLLGALAHHGLDATSGEEKDEMRELAIRGGPYSAAEKESLLDYCQSDVDQLALLLAKMLSKIDVPRALLRGRWMAAAASTEWCGTPIDVETFDAITTNWTLIQNTLIQRVNRNYGVYVPVGRKPLNPDSRVGQAVIAEAVERGLNVEELADAVEVVWWSRRNTEKPFYDAKREVRRRTGLSVARIRRWERLGGDHSTWPDFLQIAPTLALEFPELGVSHVKQDEEASALWMILSNEVDRIKPRHDPDIIAEGVELLRLNAGRVELRPMRFDAKRWAAWLITNQIPWPQSESGTLLLDDDTFSEMAKLYPTQIGPIRELRYALGQLRLHSLVVGTDGRNRCMLSAFRAKTGRNQPSNSKFIFGMSCWMRGLIKPKRGRAVAYIDWSQQEFGIGAALSGDRNMMDAYLSGDPYLAFAKLAGEVPEDATKDSHPVQRGLFKQCALAVQYGMGHDGLAERIGQPPVVARQLLRLHRETFPDYWRWSNAAVDHAMLYGWVQTVFGWRLHVAGESNPRSLANFPCQANGAEMLRLACCLLTEQGINVCAPVHDAVLIEAAADEINDVVARAQKAMREASQIILGGFPLETDVEIVRYPDRYQDDRGREVWNTVMEILGELGESVSE